MANERPSRRAATNRKEKLMATNIPSERSKAAPYPKCGTIQADLFRVTRALLDET